MTMANIDLNIYSLNANGLGDTAKRVTVFHKLKNKGEGIFLLQESHSTESTQRQWDLQWGNKNTIYSHGSSNSKGVAILFSNKFEVNVIKQCKDEEGRYIIIDIEHGDRIITIGNLYAPTRNKESEQIRVFKSFCEHLMQFKRENIIIGGDFNLYLIPKLDKLDTMPDTNDNPTYRKEIISFLETESLVDVWRVLNPSVRFFTWNRGINQKSRLDYLFMSDHILNIVSKCEILPGIQSDHSLLKIAIDNSISHKGGKGFWKFNSSLLHDTDYVLNIKYIIKNSGTKYQYLLDKSLIWELIKMDVRNCTVAYSIAKKQKQNSLEKDLYQRFSELHIRVHSDTANQLETEEFNSIKNEIELIERHKARGAILRSKCAWAEEGEKSTGYFLRLEKHNFCNKLISQIQVNDEVISKPK
jgi:exonuclease III